MPNKSFGFYNTAEEATLDINDCLVVEMGKSHIACIAVKKKTSSIAAFELFTFKDTETFQFKELFSAIVTDSKLIGKVYTKTNVYINNELSVLVPIYKFSKGIAPDYLNIVFGEDDASIIQYEHIPEGPEVMNVYRVKEEFYNVLSHNLSNVTFKHTWSNIIKSLSLQGSFNQAEFISVQFYTTFIVVVVIKDAKLSLMQSFAYETPEDVLYYLLAITQQLALVNNTLTLQISGMIDLDFKLYRELIKYFNNIHVDNVDSTNLLLDLNAETMHYFTPFFNLVS